MNELTLEILDKALRDIQINEKKDYFSEFDVLEEKALLRQIAEALKTGFYDEIPLFRSENICPLN